MISQNPKKIGKIDLRKILLATLPLLMATSHFRITFFLGAVTYLAACFTVLFFKWTQGLFPERLFKFSVILWLTALAQIGQYLAGLNPLWITSLFLLIEGPVFEEKDDEDSFKVTCWNGFGFWVLVTFLGAFHEVLGMRFALDLFRQPVGSLLLLAFVAFLWQNQPRKKPLIKGQTQ